MPIIKVPAPPQSILKGKSNIEEPTSLTGVKPLRKKYLTKTACCFSSSSIATRSSGTLNGIVKNTTASELKATDINIFTREGKHIAGTPLKLEEYSALINSKNGFLSDAVYNAEYINQD